MISLQENELLATYTTFKVGGPAEFFTEVQTEEELTELVAYSNAHTLPLTILGGGSNVLVHDEGIRGIVIKNSITGMRYEERKEDVLLTIGAGEVFDTVVADTVARGYWGLENLSHIPGSVGATPIQNVGAYGVEIADVIDSVRALNIDTGEYKSFSNTDCSFGYRDSFFKSEKGKRYIVTEVTYRLQKEGEPHIAYKDLQERFSGTVPTLTQIREAIISVRSGKFPDWHTVGTAGSFFKNPIITIELFDKLAEQHGDLPGFSTAENKVKVPLGWILDKVCNFKGLQEGNVGTYQEQALVVINTGGATAAEITHFVQKIEEAVLEKTGIVIEWEVTKMS